MPISAEITTSVIDGLYPGARELYSEDILYLSIPQMPFLPFAVIEELTGSATGDTIKVARVEGLKGRPNLTGESDDGSANMATLAGGVVEIVIDEYLFGTSITEKGLRTTPMNTLDIAVQELATHYQTWGPNRLLRDVAIGEAGAVVYGGVATDRDEVLATDRFSTKMVKDMATILRKSRTPKFRFDDGTEGYVCFVDPDHERALVDDPEWESTNNYHQTRALFTGEIGRYYGTVFISADGLPRGDASNEEESWYAINESDPDEDNPLAASTHGGGVDLVAGVMFGRRYLALATGGPVEFRDNGVENFGRKISVVWYQLYGAKTLAPAYGVRFETAP